MGLGFRVQHRVRSVLGEVEWVEQRGRWAYGCLFGVLAQGFGGFEEVTGF